MPAARMKGKATTRGALRRNPPLVVLGNPPMGEVIEIRYTHSDDGRRYKHTFGKGVQIFTNKDGSVLLKSTTGAPLWKDL